MLHDETECDRMTFCTVYKLNGDFKKNFLTKISVNCVVHGTVGPRYKEVGYNKTLLKQGNSAGPTSLYFFVFYPDIMRNLM